VNLNDAAEIIEKVGLQRLQRSLHRWREDVHLTQQELSSLAGIAQQTVSRIEKGKRNLTPRTFARLMTVIEKAFEKKQAEAVKSSQAGLSLNSIFPPEHFGQVTSLASLKDPAAVIAHLGANRETHERVQSKLIQAQAELIRILEQLLAAHGEREAEQDSKIADLEKRIADLRDLLGLETGATVLRVKADEKREQLTIAGMRKEHEKAESNE
jgi:transcriptional regulator with XRE-family HTH domain